MPPSSTVPHREGAAEGDDELPLPTGTVLGRYIVVEPLGRGGMGVVYRAYDPQLDRKVAVKVLRSGPDGQSPEQDRLLREGQAMARLAHPHVVAVHDVGTHEGRVFVAMELVEGRNLRDWLTSGPSWRQIVAMFVQTARGLAAAHAVGIVHRDFKPENALVGIDGRARVTDFGLARALGPAATVTAPRPRRQVPCRARAGAGRHGHRRRRAPPAAR